MGDAVLADDDGAIREGGGDVVGEVGVDGWDYADGVGWHAADATEEVDGAFEAAAE